MNEKKQPKNLPPLPDIASMTTEERILAVQSGWYAPMEREPRRQLGAVGLGYPLDKYDDSQDVDDVAIDTEEIVEPEMPTVESVARPHSDEIDLPTGETGEWTEADEAQIPLAARRLALRPRGVESPLSLPRDKPHAHLETRKSAAERYDPQPNRNPRHI